MQGVSDKTLDSIQNDFPDLECSQFREQVRVIVGKDRLIELLTYLKNQHQFDFLADVSCVDYLAFRQERPARFGLVYQLDSTSTNEQITVRVFLDETDVEIDSVSPLWKSANWLEREVWDMFGIQFKGHPDLRRILMPQEFTAFPLRKDYPLQGRGERHNFPVIRRDQG